MPGVQDTCGATRVTNMPGVQDTRGATRVTNMHLMTSNLAVSIISKNPNLTSTPVESSDVRPTSTLVQLYTGRVIKKRVVSDDGFESTIEVEQQEVRDFHFCSTNIANCISWVQTKDKGNQQPCPKPCPHQHYNKDRHGGEAKQNICGRALAGEPCDFGDKCIFVHPVNFPQILRASSGVATVVRASGADRAPRPPRAERAVNKVMCSLALAKKLNIALPEGKTECRGGCGSSHSVEDQHREMYQVEFDKRVSSGTLDPISMLNEVKRVLKALDASTLNDVLSITTATQLPSDGAHDRDTWFLMWSKAAGNYRATAKNISRSIGDLKRDLRNMSESEVIDARKKISKLEQDQENNNIKVQATALYTGEDCYDENMVWELVRRFKICWTSTKQFKQMLGGKEGITMPREWTDGPRVDHRKVREASEATVASLSSQREKLKAIISDKTGFTDSERELAVSAISEVNIKLAEANKQLRVAALVPMCVGGWGCKHGWHCDLVDEKGFLGAINMDNFCGRPSTRNNRSDILSVRSTLEASIAFNIEEIRKLKSANLVSTISKTERIINERKIGEMNSELDYLRNELSTSYNLLRLFPEPEIGVMVKKDVVVEPISYDLTDSDFPEPPAYEASEPSEEFKTYEKRVNTVRKMFRMERAKQAVSLANFVKHCVQTFRTATLKKFTAMASLSTEEAKKAYGEHIEKKHFHVVLGKPSKPRGSTYDLRPIFYLTESNECFTMDSSHILRPYTGFITTPSFQKELDLFNLVQFKEYVACGAFRAMDFLNFHNKFTREAWFHFLDTTSTVSWDAFFLDVSSQRAKWDNLGMVTERTLHDQHWDYDSKATVRTFDVTDVYVGCVEKDILYADFWAFYFDVPRTSDPKVVGTAGAIVTSNPLLFKEFQDSGYKGTFSDWLDSIPKYKNCVKALASFPGFSFRQVCFYVNNVQPVDSNITILTFVQNEANMRAWIVSSASKNINGEHGGVDFATYMTNPYLYQEYYSYGLNMREPSISFEQFIQDKKDGWSIIAMKKSVLDQQKSTAYLHNDHFSLAASLVKESKVWTPEMMAQGKKPTPLTFGNIVVQPSFHDVELLRLASMSRHKNHTSEVKEILSILPRTEPEAVAHRDAVCDKFLSAHQDKLVALKEELTSIAATLPSRAIITADTFTKLQQSLVSNDVENLQIQLSVFQAGFKKLKSNTHSNEFKTKVNTFIDLLRFDAVSYVDEIKASTTTTICLYTDQADKVQAPNVLTSARFLFCPPNSELDENGKPVVHTMESWWAFMTESKQVSSKSTVTVTNPAVTNPKVAKKPVASKKELSLPTADEDIFQSGEAQLGALRQTNKLLTSGRVVVPTGCVMYLVKGDKAESVSAEGKKSVINYWVFGPFPNKSSAMKVKTAISKTGGMSATVREYEEVFEVQFQDPADNAVKKALKYDGEGLESALASGMDKLISLIPAAAKAYGHTESKVFSPTLLRKASKAVAPKSKAVVSKSKAEADSDSDDDSVHKFKAVAPKAEPEDEADSDSDDDSDSDSDSEPEPEPESDDEVIIGRTMGLVRVNESWMNDEMRGAVQKSDNKAINKKVMNNKGRK